MDRRARRSLELATQFRNYREPGSRPWSGDFNSDTLSRIDVVLSHHQAPTRLPSSEDPFPPAWPIDRSVLNKAVKDFLQLTSHLTTPVTPSSNPAPSRPLGRPTTRSRASSQASSAGSLASVAHNGSSSSPLQVGLLATSRQSIPRGRKCKV